MRVLALMCAATLAGCCSGQLVQYSFDFREGPTTRYETLDSAGLVRGIFNYLDARGDVKTQSYGYSADNTWPQFNLVEPEITPTTTTTTTTARPQTLPPQDTDEGDQNTASVTTDDTTEPPADLATMASEDNTEALNAPGESATLSDSKDSRPKRSLAVVPSLYSPPLRFSYGYNIAPIPYTHSRFVGQPLTYVSALTAYPAAPTGVLGGAGLLRVVHNPVHATSYRVH